MSITTPEYYECDNCGRATRFHPHLAFHRVWRTDIGNFLNESRWLCCGCYESVGGRCDGHDD